MAVAKKRKDMVLAQTVELDVFDDDHVVVFFIENGAVQNLLYILMIPLGQKGKRHRCATRSSDESTSRGIFADLYQDFCEDVF